MSCNGCRVLRKGCSDTCVLRPCLQWIDTSEAQGHATIFVAKFFGRAGLMSFISAVPDHQRPALFQSLLFEACGRTINPIGGAVGLLWTGNWHLCQAAVDTVLRGGELGPLPGLPPADGFPQLAAADLPPAASKRRKAVATSLSPGSACDLGLCLSLREIAGGREERRPETPSMNSEGSVTTASGESVGGGGGGEPRLLDLFV
ncbi:LOB domain-containing protein 37-like [Canna indica]|uniref:LOB domain-containing protein 37-like n=1 Tax=Canna indica TaxID=4628 RepID=A0AAQ3KNJ0_9LILI|nr:LOB domain-containing protein 37-like [Canna indica]